MPPPMGYLSSDSRAFRPVAAFTALSRFHVRLAQL